MSIPLVVLCNHKDFLNGDFAAFTGIIIGAIALYVAIKSNSHQAKSLIINQLNLRATEINLIYKEKSVHIMGEHLWGLVVTPMVVAKDQYKIMKRKNRFWLMGQNDKYFKDLFYMSLDTTIRINIWQLPDYKSTTVNNQIRDVRKFLKEQKRLDSSS